MRPRVLAVLLITWALVSQVASGAQGTRYFDAQGRETAETSDSPRPAIGRYFGGLVPWVYRDVARPAIDAGRPPATDQPAASRAGRKWAIRWLTWVEDLLVTYGFFV
jgi:hypothetical protein